MVVALRFGGSCASTYHELLTVDALREAGVVLYVRCGGQLSSGCDAIGEHALVEHS